MEHMLGYSDNFQCVFAKQWCLLDFLSLSVSNWYRDEDTGQVPVDTDTTWIIYPWDSKPLCLTGSQRALSLAGGLVTSLERLATCFIRENRMKSEIIPWKKEC